MRRELQVKMVKPPKGEGYQVAEPMNPDYTDMCVFTQDAVVKVVKTVTKGVLAYVALDTFRRVAVAYASK